jgi:hypothetical protein
MYYFPYGSKVIPLSSIRKLSLLSGGVYRFHGSGDFIHWWAADYSRFGSAVSPSGYIMITVEDDSIIKCFTCENAERLSCLILQHGSDVVREDVSTRQLLLCGGS